ncbi:MAG: tryptophan-rich sensory protein, partial [Cyanobacteria bacterium J06639_14]
TVVNVAAALYTSNWNGFGLSQIGWTVVMIVIAAAIAAIVAIQRGDVAFVLVFVWALSAIAVRHTTLPAIWMTAAILAIGLIGLLIGRSIIRQ